MRGRQQSAPAFVQTEESLVAKYPGIAKFAEISKRWFKKITQKHKVLMTEFDPYDENTVTLEKGLKSLVKTQKKHSEIKKQALYRKIQTKQDLVNYINVFREYIQELLSQHHEMGEVLDVLIEETAVLQEELQSQVGVSATETPINSGSQSTRGNNRAVLEVCKENIFGHLKQLLLSSCIK